VLKLSFLVISHCKTQEHTFFTFLASEVISRTAIKKSNSMNTSAAARSIDYRLPLGTSFVSQPITPPRRNVDGSMLLTDLSRSTMSTRSNVVKAVTRTLEIVEDDSHWRHRPSHCCSPTCLKWLTRNGRNGGCGKKKEHSPNN
jgi:hypothetical protein